MLSCSKKVDYGQPNVNLKKIEKNYIQWWIYYNDNIVLSSDFTAIDEVTHIISKGDFLKQLTSGDFIPVKLTSKDSITYYKLFKLDKTASKDISNTIRNVSKVGYKFFKMEGKKFPDFDFTDIDGIHYTNKNTKGKMVILKCWFISCKPCVAEIPELNKLVERYKNRKDILFISLAFDSKKDLKSFILKNPFKYAIVPNQKDFMENILQVYAYPTHFIIDKRGVLKNVVNTATLISILENKTFIKENLIKRPPPPPPPAPRSANKSFNI